MQTLTATYSPEDNKLRLYSALRLEPDLYARVKAHGFSWAPKQELFVAPKWTPNREDLLLELCGEIGDEDTSLVERAEERADRFEDYSAKRAHDADRAREGVEAITQNIPLGQPILVGHHSERHARKDAERIENGMRHAVKMWETSRYWEDRAAGALRHAKYKELPAVRHRRVKGLEADKRRHERDMADAEKFTKLWEKEGLDLPRAKAITNRDHISKKFTLAEYPRESTISQYEGDMSLWSALDHGIITAEQAREIALPVHARTIVWAKRWIQHYENRIAYERAMLQETGGLKGEAFDYQVGGQIQRRGQWFPILKINKRDGAVNSLTVSGHWCSTIPIGDVQDYQPPKDGDAEKAKAKAALPPICNYPGEGFIYLTKEECEAKTPKWSDFSKYVYLAETETHARCRVRQIPDPEKQWGRRCVYITDAKLKERPLLALQPPTPVIEVLQSELPAPRPVVPKPEPSVYDRMKEQLRSGVAVQVVSADQLFPTPADLCARMVEMAEIEPGMTVLEPSAGTGAIVKAIIDAVDTEIVAYDINFKLCQHINTTFPSFRVKALHQDFLTVTNGMGQFPRILMNPPFANGADIKHVQHAMKFLEPGGRLVAIMANGPRQAAFLKECEGAEWEALPEGTFKDSGTGVNTQIVTITAPVRELCEA